MATIKVSRLDIAIKWLREELEHLEYGSSSIEITVHQGQIVKVHRQTKESEIQHK